MTVVASLIALLRDTGWRDVNLTGTANLTSGHLYLRRQGDKVSVECNWVGVGATPALAAFIPAGFRPSSPNPTPQSKTVSAVDGALAVAITVAPASGDTSVSYKSGSTPPSNSGAKWSAEWRTADAWPTTLPGVATP